MLERSDGRGGRKDRKRRTRNRGGGKSGARRRGRVEDERRGNEKERLELLPSPPHTLPLSLSLSLSLLSLPPALFSEALIFNDILGCTEVPLMHGHYNMVFSLPLPPPSLSLSLSLYPLQRTRACVYIARDSPPAAAFSIGQRFILFFSSFLDAPPRRANEPSKVARRLVQVRDMHYTLIYDPRARERERDRYQRSPANG